jgi:Sec-independent protein secretion pathway component TatC
MEKPGHKKTIPFWLCLIVSIGLLVGGFFVPPMGVIDGSVLTAVGILFAFGTLAQIPIIIEVAGYAKIVKGDTTIEISRDEE